MVFVSDLPDGYYSFIDERFPLGEMSMGEAPSALRALLVDQAARNGVTIVRDRVVEVRCVMQERPDAAFTVFWPSDSETIYMLMPKRHVVGRA